MQYTEHIISPDTGWIVLSILSVLWVSLGIYWGRKAKDLEGHMLAGRDVGLALGMATVMATWVTSNTTMLAPQFVLEMGVWGMLAYSTAAIGLLLFAFLAKRIRKMMPKGFTSGDFIRLRYGKAAWFIFLIISIFYSLIWLISMGMAGGILMNAIAGIPYFWGTTIILAVCVAYTLFGGLYAVIGTDYIQSLLIMIGIVIVGFGVIQLLDFNEIYMDVEKNSPMLLNFLFPAALMSVFNNLLFSVGEVFHSNVWWSRIFALRESVNKKAYIMAGLAWIPIPIAAGFIALSSSSLGINIIRPDMVGAVVSSTLLGPTGAVIVFIVLFSSLASSIDAVLAAIADLITQDIYKKILRPKATDQELRKFAAIIIVAVGFIAWAAAIPNIGTLASILFLAGPMVGSTIWPILTGLFWKNASKQGAFWGMLLGSACGLISYFFVGWYTSSLVGAAVSMLVVLACRKWFPDDFEWSLLNEAKTDN